MAASKAPKHDFAPAWLKIPDDKNQKPAGPKSSEHKEKNPHRRKDFPFDYPYGGMLPRQRSFEHYFDAERHYPTHKFRQHSLEEEYYDSAAAYYNGYYNGYPVGAFRPGPANFRDPKYSPHNGMNSRYAHLNGAYPAYCDPYGYDFYPDRFSGGRPVSGRSPSKSHHKPTDKDRTPHKSGGGGGGDSGQDAKSGEKEEGAPNGRGDGDLEEEFPSLNGELEPKREDPVDKNKISSGVWDKNSRGKLLQHNKEADNNQVNSKLDNCNKDIKHNHTHIYKALVPNKNKVVKRGNNKESPKLGSLAKDINSNNSNFSRHNKENNAESPSTPPIDILNTRLVTTPKNLSDKKSDFLKALKQENDLNTADSDNKGAKLHSENKQDLPKSLNNTNNSATTNNTVIYTSNNMTTPTRPLQNGGVGMVNGFEELSLENDSGMTTPALSSSLEAEQRLLREMGWSEDDDENPPITEEEMREIQQLSKHIKELKENSEKNGLKRSLPKTWSPQHMPTYNSPSALQQLNSTVSSGDSDSDDSDLG